MFVGKPFSFFRYCQNKKIGTVLEPFPTNKLSEKISLTEMILRGKNKRV